MNLKLLSLLLAASAMTAACSDDDTTGPAAGEARVRVVSAGDRNLWVTPAGSTTVVIDSGALSLASGQVRTAIAVDAPGGGAPFDLLLLADLN